jgi:hypothetical protein
LVFDAARRQHQDATDRRLAGAGSAYPASQGGGTMTAPGLYALIDARSQHPAPPIPSNPRDRIREWLILEYAAKHRDEFDALLIGDAAIAPIDSLSRMKDDTPVRPPPTR